VQPPFLRRKAMNRKRKMIIAGAACGAVAAGLIFLLVWLVFMRSASIEGRWAMDDVTEYEFSGDGSGKLCLPTEDYPFVYRVNGDTVSVDFIDPTAEDRVYTYEVSSKELTLTAANGAVYKMTRKGPA